MLKLLEIIVRVILSTTIGSVALFIGAFCSILFWDLDYIEIMIDFIAKLGKIDKL